MVSDLVDGSSHMASLRQAREPQIEDLLGRTPVPIDLETVRRSLAGRRVLVTGAGGSIGSEISRQVAELDPALLVLLDHDETHLHDTAATVMVTCEQALVDINDRSAVMDVFEKFRPEVVFHAAAHKHVPVLEHHPIEAARTNVFGTLNVVEAAVKVGSQRFVQISTDKAVRPSSVMGASKRFAEQIVLSRAPAGASYCTVRFGNVLGSRGSVIPTFSRQIATGGPVTVTDARMTRFFMSVEESVQLVLEASVLSDGGGEVFMLEMGEPIRILELAERMIRLSGYEVGVDIPIRIIGIRPGEKLDEELRTPEEEVLTTQHPYINQLIPITVPADDLADGLGELRRATECRDADMVRKLLFDVPSSNTDTSGVVSEEVADVGANGLAPDDPVGPSPDRPRSGQGTARVTVNRTPSRPASPGPVPNKSRHEPAAGYQPVSEDRDATRLVVVGQGYVGLPLALRAAEVGYHVIGFDLDVERIKLLAGEARTSGTSPTTASSGLWPRGASSPRTIPSASPDSTSPSSMSPPHSATGSPTSPSSSMPPSWWPGTSVPACWWCSSRPAIRGPPRSWWLPFSKRSRPVGRARLPPGVQPRTHRPRQQHLEVGEHTKGDLRSRRGVAPGRGRVLQPDRGADDPGVRDP